MRKKPSTRGTLAGAIAAGATLCSVLGVLADGPQSFLFLHSDFTQSLFGVRDLTPSDPQDPFSAPHILGGVAFAPDGDVWSADCQFPGTTLFRFDRGSSSGTNGTHPVSVVDLTAGQVFPTHPDWFPDGIGGCGLINHPDGFMYMNSSAGIWRLDADSGLPIDPATGQKIDSSVPAGTPLPPNTGPLGVPGNALGIAVDPVADVNGHFHIVYVGADCHPSLSVEATTCTLYDLDPVTGTTMVFARLSHHMMSDPFDPEVTFFNDFLDGIYFDPSGQVVFGAYREKNDAGVSSNALKIITRPAALLPLGTPADDPAVRVIPMVAEPDGVAFYAPPPDSPPGTPGFVVTLNESNSSSTDCVDGTGVLTSRVAPMGDPMGAPVCPMNTVPYPSGGSMTKFVFDGDYLTGSVSQNVFAAGGFRGDLLQVGADGCIYATQGALFESSGTAGVRYDDGSTNLPDVNTNSVVKICGGFAVPPGVGGRIGDFVWNDLNHDGRQDAGEPGLPGVTVRLREYHGSTDIKTTMTDASGHYQFANLALASYTVVVDTPAGYAPTMSQVPSDTARDSNGSPADVTVAIDSIARLDIDFGFYQAPAAIAIVKKTNGTDNDSAPGPTVAVGSTVTWTYEVTNPGGTTLTNVTVTDDKAGAIGCPKMTLAAAESMTCTKTGIAVVGPYTNVGTARGTPPAGSDVTASNPDNYFGAQPGISILKTTNGTDNDSGTGPIVAVGSTVTWTYLVINVGNVPLTAVAVTDDKVGAIGCPKTTLAALESMTCTKTGVAVAGQYTNMGTVTGTPPVGGVVTASNPDHYFGAAPACSGSIGDFVWNDLNRNSLQDVGEPGLPNVPVTLKNSSGAVVASTTTSAGGTYQFTGLCAGTYSVEAVPPVGFDQTGTRVGSNVSIDSNGSPASVTLAANSSDMSVDFGYVNGFCEKQPVQTELSPAGTHFPGNKGPDVVVRTHLGQSVQAALDQAADLNGDGYIIVGVIARDGGLLGGHPTQQVVVNRVYSLPFALVGCSVTLHDPNPGDANPTARILASASAPVDGIGARIFVMDLHGNDSAVAGWLVEGNNRYLRNVEARNNAVGVRFIGNSNTMHNGAVESNQGAGLVMEGNSNKVDSTDAFSNGGHGIQVTGNTNQILKTDVGDKNKGNAGDGLHVEGSGNVLQENDAYSNGGDGIEMVATSGSPNILKKNTAGEKGGLGNAGNGILVAGPGNGTATPIELEENTVKANGLVGIRVLGTNHQLKNNVSGGTGSGETNIGCEFNVAAGNFNATGNKANGTTVSGSNGSPFPTGCVGSQ